MNLGASTKRQHKSHPSSLASQGPDQALGKEQTQNFTDLFLRGGLQTQELRFGHLPPSPFQLRPVGSRSMFYLFANHFAANLVFVCHTGSF